jgi:hypothetical protein
MNISFGTSLIENYTPKRVKKLIETLGLTPLEIQYNDLFKNNPTVITSITKSYIQTKLRNAILFSLFLFFSLDTLVYTVFHKKNIDKDVSSLVFHHLSKICFSLSILFLCLMLVIDYRRSALFYPTKMKLFLISFYVYTLSILLYRKYTVLAEADKYEILIDSYFYVYLALISLSIFSLFVLFLTFFIPLDELQLCKYFSHSTLPVWYIVGFFVCAYVLVRLIGDDLFAFL